MIEDYLTDTVDIITRTYDKNGVVTATSTQSGVGARIEDKNQMVRNQAGQEVASRCYLMIDPSATVKYESKIKLKTQNGAATQFPDKELAVLSLGRGHGFDFEYWRVWL